MQHWLIAVCLALVLLACVACDGETPEASIQEMCDPDVLMDFDMVSTIYGPPCIYVGEPLATPDTLTMEARVSGRDLHMFISGFDLNSGEVIVVGDEVYEREVGGEWQRDEDADVDRERRLLEIALFFDENDNLLCPSLWGLERKGTDVIDGVEVTHYERTHSSEGDNVVWNYWVNADGYLVQTREDFLSAYVDENRQVAAGYKLTKISGIGTPNPIATPILGG